MLKTNRSDCQCGGACGGHVNAPHRFAANIVSGEARRQTINGRSTLVVPVIMARANVVMNGGLLPADEMHANDWNGTPVTMGHPTNDAGDFISAANADVHAAWACGVIANAEVRDDTLRGEAHIDIERANALHAGIITRLEGSTAMDVSTGYNCRDEKKAGTSNGRRYNEIHRDIQPDHLALLPNQVGACSWQDGCGIRSNQKDSVMGKVQDALDTLKAHFNSKPDDADPLVAERLAANEKLEQSGIKLNELSQGGIWTELQRQLDRMDSAVALHFLSEVYSDYFVYKVRPGSQASGGAESETYRRSYSVSEADDSVDMQNDPVKVRRVVEYRPISNEQEVRNVADKSKEPSLIAGEVSKVNAAALQAQFGVDEATATKMVDAANAKTEAAPKANEDSVSSGDIKEMIANGLKEALSGFGLNADDRAALDAMKANADARKEALVQKVVAHTNITADQMKDWPVSQIEAVANGIRPAANYGGRGAPSPVANAGVDEESEGMRTHSLSDILSKSAPKNAAEVN